MQFTTQVEPELSIHGDTGFAELTTISVSCNRPSVETMDFIDASAAARDLLQKCKPWILAHGHMTALIGQQSLPKSAVPTD